MSYKIIIRPEAEADISESFRWYQGKVPGFGIEFLSCVDDAFDLIIEDPKIYQKIYKNVRRCLTHRFPYEIFYIIEGDNIIVLAVLHAKRDPSVLKKRRSK
ncbi:MAG TPA: type II toxin-antitoxin system RelE/ParE family toxin [Candidatus Kapabacteria bacterium]|nr:type II toxin-antitoxin system RelE/ParE family toxin [Candidatus Kapabacteria bacterium]